MKALIGDPTLWDALILLPAGATGTFMGLPDSNVVVFMVLDSETQTIQLPCGLVLVGRFEKGFEEKKDIFMIPSQAMRVDLDFEPYCFVRCEFDWGDYFIESMEDLFFMVPEKEMIVSSRGDCGVVEDYLNNCVITPVGEVLDLKFVLNQSQLANKSFSFESPSSNDFRWVEIWMTVKKNDELSAVLRLMKDEISSRLNFNRFSNSMERSYFAFWYTPVTLVCPLQRKPTSKIKDSKVSIFQLYQQRNLVISPHKHRLVRMKTPTVASIVKGDFEFFHYTSEDAGWGCAYRSLQHVLSWQLFSNLTLNSVPSIKDLQEKLVNLGCMGTCFFSGCEEWIGSQEIGWILMEYGLTPRYLFGESACQLIENHASEIFDHFRCQGSPIVLCSGQKAFTLLGIGTSSTNIHSLLVADPHYKGIDIVERIVSVSVLMEGDHQVPVSWRPIAFLGRGRLSITFPT